MPAVNRTAPIVARPVPSFPGYYVLGHLVIRQRADGVEVHVRGDRALLGQMLRYVRHQAQAGVL